MFLSRFIVTSINALIITPTQHLTVLSPPGVPLFALYFYKFSCTFSTCIFVDPLIIEWGLDFLPPYFLSGRKKGSWIVQVVPTNVSIIITLELGEMFFSAISTTNEGKSEEFYLFDCKGIWQTPTLLIYKSEHSSHIFRLFTFFSKVV